jgi:ferrochelatase
MAFAPETTFRHDRAPKVGVLLVNLGTPDEPTPAAVRRYLAEFLADPRVVEIPPLLWRPILHGVILRVRPAKSAAKYRTIWTKDGSPLAVHTARQRAYLQGYLGERLKRAGLPAELCPVEAGMRYGNPSIAKALDALRAADCERILVLPLYPQYAGSTTATAFDKVAQHVATLRRVPSLRFAAPFHDDAGYVKALAQSINDYWVKHGRPDRLVMSFHGVPRRTLDMGDPYHCQCHKTGRLLADELGLDRKQWVLTFQSRFGKAEWLKPYTAPTLEALAREGVKRVDVACPGFVSDCLETLEEIGMEGRDAFLAAGGREYHAIPCLNEHPAWLAALADIAWRELAGWLAPPPDAAAREQTLLRAKALGAPR